MISGRTRRYSVAFALWVLLLACSREPSATDRDRLAILKQQYGARYDFDFDGSLYVRVTARDTAVIRQADLEEIYRRFMLDQSGRRRNTTIVYFNAYDVRGQFLYQLAFDPKAGRFVVGDAEHY